MNNDNLRDFINGIGLICETWSMTYTKFIEMGYTHEAALDHTKGVMTTFLAAFPGAGGNSGG